jgi:hypothetical protein
VHSSLLGSAQSRMHRLDSGAAWTQIPRCAWGDLPQVEEAVDVVSQLPQHVGEATASDGL